MNGHQGFEHLIVTCLIAVFAVAAAGLAALIVLKLVAHLTGAM